MELRQVGVGDAVAVSILCKSNALVRIDPDLRTVRQCTGDGDELAVVERNVVRHIALLIAADHGRTADFERAAVYIHATALAGGGAISDAAALHIELAADKDVHAAAAPLITAAGGGAVFDAAAVHIKIAGVIDEHAAAVGECFAADDRAILHGKHAAVIDVHTAAVACFAAGDRATLHGKHAPFFNVHAAAILAHVVAAGDKAAGDFNRPGRIAL